MPAGRALTLNFPDFRGFIRALILTCTVVFALLLLLQHAAPLFGYRLEQLLWLRPVDVMHGAVWQLVTYSFLHASVLHLVFNMLSLWFVGTYLEEALGSRRVAACYFVSVLGAGLVTVVLFYLRILGLDPGVPTVGASGGIFGILVAFAVLFGDRAFMMFPLPFTIKAKYLVAIYIVIALLSFLSGGQNGTAYVAHLGGALFGYVYIKSIGGTRAMYLAGGSGPGIRRSGSEAYYGLRNAWHRFKRRRAAKKFEVYMRKHGGR